MADNIDIRISCPSDGKFITVTCREQLFLQILIDSASKLDLPEIIGKTVLNVIEKHSTEQDYKK